MLLPLSFHEKDSLDIQKHRIPFSIKINFNPSSFETSQNPFFSQNFSASFADPWNASFRRNKFQSSFSINWLNKFRYDRGNILIEKWWQNQMMPLLRRFSLCLSACRSMMIDSISADKWHRKAKVFIYLSFYGKSFLLRIMLREIFGVRQDEKVATNDFFYVTKASSCAEKCGNWWKKSFRLHTQPDLMLLRCQKGQIMEKIGSPDQRQGMPVLSAPACESHFKVVNSGVGSRFP